MTSCGAATPERVPSEVVTLTSPSPPPSRRGNASSHAAGAPRERSAPRVMSPEIPAAGWRIAMRMGAERWGEHTSELQSQANLVCRLLLAKKKKPASAQPGHVRLY